MIFKESVLLWLCAILIFIAAPNVGAIDQCPEAKSGKQDGLIDDPPDKFTFESWIKESKDKKGQVIGHKFGRCIENRGDKELWTHWKGILSSGWIPKGERKLHVTRRNSKASNDKNKNIWFGDARNKKATAETECWKGEKACQSPDTTHRRVGFVQATYKQQPDWNLSESNLVNTLLVSQGQVSTYTYGEIFIPSNTETPNQRLLRLSIKLVSAAYKEGVAYTLFTWIRKSDLDDRISPYIKEGAVPLFTIKFPDKFLATQFGGEQEFASPRLQEIINDPSKPVLTSKINIGGITDYFYYSSHIEIVDITKNVNLFPVNIYRPG